MKPASVILGKSTGSATFAANDVAMSLTGSNYVGYGLGGTTGSPVSSTLYKVVIPVSVITANSNSSQWSGLTSQTIANAVTVTSLGGITFPSGHAPASGDSFGAAYVDSSGDAFFYANTAKYLFEATSAQLATGTAFAPRTKRRAPG